MTTMNFYAASAFFNGLLALFVVFHVYLRNKTNPLNRSFLYFGISVAGWSLIYSLWAWADNPVSAEFFVRSHMMFAAFIPATFFHFSLHLTSNYPKFRRLAFINYVICAVASVLMRTNLMITGVRKILFFEYWGIPGRLLYFYVAFYFAVVAFSFYLLLKKFIASSGHERKQSLWILTAFLIGFGGGSTNWFIWFDIPVPPLTNFFIGVTFAMIAYAIVRYKLMDVDALVEVLRSSRTSALGLLAASMNHELRNPLYIAKGKIESQIDAIERGVFSGAEQEMKKSREVLAVALRQLERGMDIMGKFSGFARIDSPDAVKEPVPVRGVLEDVVGLAQHEIQMKRIRVDLSGVNGQVISANRRQLEEIFFNLIMNACQAIKAQDSEVRAQGSESLKPKDFLPDPRPLIPETSSPSPLGQIVISASQQTGRINITIRDNGPGIPKEIQRRLFEPFFTTKTGSGGTGLGLYITKQLVERNGGKISVKSQLQKGTEFQLQFKR